jgi:UDP-glucose 4-epimerase
MKLVVTGGLGHIGSKLLHGIRPGEFEEVVIVDDLSTQRYVSLFDLPAGVRMRFVEADVLTADLPGLFAGAHSVVHLAATVNAGASFVSPEEAERVNHEGAMRVARACLDTGSRLFFPSTTSVYSASGRLSEEVGDVALRAQTPYAESKLRSENDIRLLREHGLRFAICRFGTVFGTSPGMRFHTAVNRFAWQACLGLPLTVWKTAMNQQRPYLDVNDAVGAIRFLLREDLFDGALYNVATLAATVSDILEALRRHVPEFEVRLVDSPAMNEYSYAVSCEKIERAGFRFEGSLDRGLRETVALLRNAGGAAA